MTSPTVTQEEENARGRGMDYAATFCIDALANMLGVEDYRICDGTEEWEGDVRGTLWNILVAANVIDEEDGAISRHRTAHSGEGFTDVTDKAATEYRIDMANVGEALVEALRDYSSHSFMQGWHPADCPTEIVGDLLNALDEAHSSEGRELPWLEKLVRYHETDGQEGDGSDHAMRNARAELDSIRSGEGRSNDDVLRCDECGCPNPVWFAPSDVWNLAVGGTEATDDPGGVLCPNCFIPKAEAAGITPNGWRLAPEGRSNGAGDFDRIDAVLNSIAFLAALKNPNGSLGHPANMILATLTAPPTSEERLRDWQSIEGAPKDRPILVIGLPPLWKGYPFVVRWDASLEGGEGWWRHMDPSLDELYSVSDSITHWSDYAVPPAALSNEGAGR